MRNPFSAKPKAWNLPGGTLFSVYRDMADQPHLLIGGATGSGKSVVISGILHALLHHSPAKVQLILLDPKRVELRRYAHLPHVVRYADGQDTMPDALRQAVTITERRFSDMARRGILMYDGPDLYVIIDELADLMTTQRKVVMPLIQRLAQIGRAARVHVIAATQCPLISVIPTPIKVNFDSVVGLRTRCAQDSRNLLGVCGCESLPRYGQGYFRTAEGTTLYNLPMVSGSDIAALITWWTGKQCKA